MKLSRKKFWLFIQAIIMCCFIACSFNQWKETDLKEIASESSFRKNIQLAKDLASYDYSSLWKEHPDLFTTQIRSHIKWKYQVDSVASKVFYRIRLQNDALKKEREVKDAFLKFIDRKISLYYANERLVDSAITNSFMCSEWMRARAHEVVWNDASPEFQKMMSKEKLQDVIRKMPQIYRPYGKRKLHSRLIYEEAFGRKGIYYVINYTYPNNVVESITLTSDLKLFGFKTDTIPAANQ